VDVSAEDAKAVLKRETGGLADVVVDVTASAPKAFLQALDLVRPGGTVVVAGTRGTRSVERFNPDRIVFKELRLLGARGVDGTAYSAALDLLASNENVRVVTRQTVGLDPIEIGALLDSMAHGPDRPLHAVVAVAT
jgi:alcohol dehydrogenase